MIVDKASYLFRTRQNEERKTLKLELPEGNYLLGITETFYLGLVMVNK